jgi:DnaK suppressor protein
VEVIVNSEPYRQQLLAEQQRLLRTLEDTAENARESSGETVADWSDLSVNDEERGEDYEEADLESKTLNQVREALKRMDAGTFGKCLVDGRPISEKRLNAIPWTPYCLEHEQQLEARNPPRTPTL